MADIRITNCHIHTFTNRHVPSLYPSALLWPFRQVPGLVAALAWAARALGQEHWADTLGRLGRFQASGDVWRQREVLDAARRQYPAGTRFVVLPMDLGMIGYGGVAAGIAAQHDELAAMAAAPGLAGLVIPFATIFPDRPGGAAEVRRCIDGLGFRGLKLYTRLGYPPDHPVLMREVYPLLAERGLPVMAHCSRGGVQGRHVVRARADRLTDPAAWVPVLDAFPALRVCLAHFGGSADWRAYIDDGLDPDDPAARAANWQVAIRDMIGSGRWPNLWTDISYTLFDFERNLPFLRVFLADETLAARVLFGSDYYMTAQETLSERAVAFRLRDGLGEALFRQIAETNPAVWLGEAAA